MSAGSLQNIEEVTRILVGLLSGGSEGRRERVLHALWKLVSDNPEHQVAIAKAGGAEPLVLLLRDGGKREHEYALWSLSLAIDEHFFECAQPFAHRRPRGT